MFISGRIYFQHNVNGITLQTLQHGQYTLSQNSVVLYKMGAIASPCGSKYFFLCTWKKGHLIFFLYLFWHATFQNASYGPVELPNIFNFNFCALAGYTIFLQCIFKPHSLTFLEKKFWNVAPFSTILLGQNYVIHIKSHLTEFFLLPIYQYCILPDIPLANVG